MSLVSGSYENIVRGLTLRPKSLTSIFSYSPHVSSVTTVAVCGSVFASGSSDETIQLYNLANKSFCSLHCHSATVTALSFYAPPHLPVPLNLLSADAAGFLNFFDAVSNRFVHLKTLSVHDRAAINDLAVHPSGKVALTVASDKCFAMVDLVNGRRSFCHSLGKEASLVKYNAAGDRFFIAAKEKVSVHEAEDLRFLFEFECSEPVLCAAPARNGLLYTGTQDRSITAWDIKSGKVAHCMEEAHAARVKGIVVVTDSDGVTGDDDDPYLVASASSDGIIRVWDVRMAARDKPLAEYNTNSRVTCLAGSSLKLKTKQGNKKQRNKRKVRNIPEPNETYSMKSQRKCEIETEQDTRRKAMEVENKKLRQNREPNLTQKTKREIRKPYARRFLCNRVSFQNGKW